MGSYVVVQIDGEFGLDKVFTRNATPSVEREWRELPEGAVLGKCGGRAKTTKDTKHTKIGGDL
jgi:hypothetical protein